MPSTYAKKIIDMLSPSIGEFMATRKVSAACILANLDVEKVGPSHKKDLSRKLEITCKSLGRNVAKSIRQRVESIS